MFTINRLIVIKAVFCLLGGLSLLPAQDVQFINAAAVPAISLAIDGKVLYPNFPQGLYTAGSATNTGKITCKIKDLSGGGARTLTMNFTPNSRQALVIYGDFSPLADQNSTRKTVTPNVKLLPLDYALAEHESPLRYRVVNLIPDRPLQLLNGDEVIDLPFEQSFAISGQKAIATLTARIGRKEIPVLIHQRQVLRNCDVIFYESGTGPAFIRFFEPNE